jgi:hypothetical protein
MQYKAAAHRIDESLRPFLPLQPHQLFGGMYMQDRQGVRNWIQLVAIVALAVTMTRGQTQPIGEPRFATVPADTEALAAVAASSTTTIPHWSDSFPSGVQKYAYSMVGASPILQPSSRTVVNTEIQPVAFKFSNGVSIHGNAAASAIANSPLFVNTKFQTGTGQYGDVFQRANFAKYIGTKPYHVLLGLPSIRPEVVITVPSGSGSTYKKAGVTYGLVDFAFVTKTMTNLVKAGKFNPTSLPIFAAGNVFEYQQISVLCCILGFHNATSPATGQVVTYIYTSFPSSGLFSGGFADTAVLSHEVGEWMDDPFGTNQVRYWSTPQHPGYCFSNLLEVGDAIEEFSNATFTVTLNGKSYHLQDLAFFSWFTGTKPSVGAGGRYSYLSPAKLTAPAKFCQ